MTNTFLDVEGAKAWAAKKGIDAKKFAAENELWCFTVVTVDLMKPNSLNARSVYAEERVDIEKAYSKIVENIKSLNIPYYIVNNFDFSRGCEYGDLAENMRF